MSKVFEDDRLKLTVQDDWLSATLMLAPKNDGMEYNLNMVLQFLLDCGIKMGVDKDIIINYIENKKLYEPFVVATGKPAVDGENARYELFFEPLTEVKPQIKADGSVDYLNTKLFLEAKAGDELARYIPPTPGVFGFNIEGQILSPRKGRDIAPLRGRGLQKVPDSDIYIAAVTGRIENKFNEINIHEIYEHRGNLDRSHSNIRFSGDVKIYGDVEGGMLVDALGSVEITGHVGGATIKSGKDVILKNGVQGAGCAYIEAKGDVYGNFFEDAQIHTGGNINANYLLNCESYACGKILIHGKHGVILGGITHGVACVEAHNIGNASETPTDIKFGVGETIMYEYAQVAEKIKKIDDELAGLETGLMKVSQMKDYVEKDEYDKAYTKLVQAKIIKNTEKKKNLERRKELFELINLAGTAYVSAHDTIYPGTTLYKDTLCKKILTRYTNTMFRVVDGGFVICPAE